MRPAPIPRSRAYLLGARIHDLGPRALAELLIGILSGCDALARIEKYAELDPAIVAAVGARDLPVIFKAPVEKTSKAGNAYVTATIRDGSGDAARWWKALVFGDDAMAEVLRLGDGDPLAVAGEFDCQAYETDAGEDRLSWKITADAVLSTRAKPKKAKPSQDKSQPFDTKRWEGGPDDGIPF
jgi:hypothetical protein